jgi:hypothetical protein
MKIDGRCHCGCITYETEIDPEKVLICHCGDCQTLTGSTFRTVALTYEDAFKLLSGELQTYVKTGESGAVLLGKGRKSARSAWAPRADATSSSRKSSFGFALHSAGSLTSTLFLRSKSNLLSIAPAPWLELAPVWWRGENLGSRHLV